MSEPLTDEELARLANVTTIPHEWMGRDSALGDLVHRLVAEVRRLRAENQKFKSMLGRPSWQVGRLDEHKEYPVCDCSLCRRD